MDKQQALAMLSIEPNANAEDIKSALAAKRTQIQQKYDAAPTDALKEKFSQMLTQLDEAEALLRTIDEPVSKNPSPLSQTKLADLPGMGAATEGRALLSEGQTLAGRYQIKAHIGAGGMGAVYRAFDQSMGRDIALKVLLPELFKNESARARFLNEARISQQLSHPNIVNVFDVQNDGELYFLTMELLEGQDLRQVMENRALARQPFTVEEVQEIAAAIGAALTYAHKFTVHRDLKPENVWLTEDGDYKLMDFGIAQVQSASQRTKTGAAMGTAYYMAPEQLKGQKDIDGRADQYALAVMLYELLSGEVPAGMIEPLNQHRKDVPKKMVAAIHQGLASKPDSRFADIEQFLVVLGNKGGAFLPALPWKNIGLAAGVLIALLGVGGLLSSGSVDWASLLPKSKEEIAAQKANVAKAQGEIKVYKQRLESGRRQLDSDVRDAQRNSDKNLVALQHWQDITERAIFGGNQITELEGQLSMAETLLRENAFEQAQATIAAVSEGYKALWQEFTAAESTYAYHTQLQFAKSNWQSAARAGQYGAGQFVQSAEEQTQIALETGQAGQFTRQRNAIIGAIGHYQSALREIKRTEEERKAAAAVKAEWQAIKRKYSLTDNAAVITAKSLEDNAVQQSIRGLLSAAMGKYQQAAQQWQQAINNERENVARIERQRVAAEAERTRAAAAARARAAEKAAERARAAAAAAAAEQARLVATVVGELVTIPAGSFRMGDLTGNGEAEERPVRTVSIRAFKMQAHEVTWAQYQPCIDAGACSDNRRDGGDNGWGEANSPIINVSYVDIVNHYIPWLNKTTGQRFRLPSEAEWEYAARAGSTTDYPWGNSVGSNRAKCKGCGDDWSTNPKPVKSFAPNEFGLYDMHGNVWEWVADCWHKSYQGAPKTGDVWPGGNCNMRGLRGGSLYSDSDGVRSANRNAGAASSRSIDFGFRLVQDL